MNQKSDFNRLLGEEEENDSFSTVILTVLIVIMVGIFAFISFFQLCYVNGQSMTDTIQNGDNVLLTRYDTEYKTGDIIVLDVKNGTSSTRLIKRVIAVENDIFKFEQAVEQTGGGNGGKTAEHVYIYKKINGEFRKIDEPYIKETMLVKNFSNKFFRFGEEYTVPENSYLFLGDNRNDSSDSRVYGFADKSQIIGKSVKILKKGSFLEAVIKIIFNAHQIEDENKSTVKPIISYPQCV